MITIYVLACNGKNVCKRSSTTWTGANGSVWSNAANWDNGVPNATTDVTIPVGVTNYPTISAAATCNAITLENGATLIGQENLTASGTVSVEKTIVAYSAPGSDDGWYAIAAPVSGMDIAGSEFEPVEDEDDFYVFDPATNYWLNYYDNNNPASLFDEFDPATGYLVSYASANAGTKSFVGPFNANASYVENPSNSGNCRWNLIGNPYPSKVTWADVAKTAVSSPKNINLTTGAWEDIATTVDVAEGIFVYAEDGTPSITFELADQSDGAKSLKSISNTIKLNSHFGEHNVSLSLNGEENAASTYDWMRDARYLYPATQIPYLCAITSDDIQVSKFAFDNGEAITIIPLYFRVNEEQEISFSIEEFKKANSNQIVTLEDTYLNEFVILSNGDYAFTASPNDDELRFKLHIESSNGVETALTQETITIYAAQNRLFLNSSKQQNATVQLFNIAGQEMMQKAVVLGDIQKIKLEVEKGWYLVKVTTENGVTSKKVFVM